MDPLGGRGEDAAVGHCVFEVRSHLQELVSGLKLALVFGAAVPDHNLRRVLVGHHDGR